MVPSASARCGRHTEAKIFGTTTKKATVNAALRAAVNREKRREFADWLKAGGLPDLTGDVKHDAA